MNLVFDKAALKVLNELAKEGMECFEIHDEDKEHGGPIITTYPKYPEKPGPLSAYLFRSESVTDNSGKQVIILHDIPVHETLEGLLSDWIEEKKFQKAP